MKRLLFPLLVALPLLATLRSPTVRASDSDSVADLSDFSEVVETTSESAVEVTIGTNAGDNDAGITYWVLLDLRGLGPVALQRVTDAMNCVYDNNPPSMIDRMLCRLDNDGAGQGWVQASDGSQRYVDYVVTNTRTFRRLKWLSTQINALTIIDAKWSVVRTKPGCNLFFPKVTTTAGTFNPCAQNSPPAVFYGLNPN